MAHDQVGEERSKALPKNMGYGGGTAALDSQTSGGPVAGRGAGEPMDSQGEF